jgi:hypothetical protein
VLLQASALGPQGEGDSSLAIAFTVQGASKRAARCGSGCYRATLPAAGRPAAVMLDVRVAETSTHWAVALPSSWPPKDAGGLIARAGQVWRSLASLSFREDLASDSRHRLTSTWRVEAPDRLAYQVRGGWAGIVIGAHRWDRAPAARRWQPSPQTPISQPVPFWVAATDTHLLGATRVQGRSAWLVSFFDPRTPAWFTVALDPRTLHTLELRMVTTAHFMHDVYGSFDATAPIRPPATLSAGQ